MAVRLWRAAMADIAKLGIEADSSQLDKLTAALREVPKAASAAERAAEKWSTTTKEAGRSAEDFSRKVKRTIADLEFERQQLARSATERARFATLRRAGVAEASAEGQAILASVRALEAQRAALGHVALGTRAVGAAAATTTSVLRTMLSTLGPIALAFLAVQKVMEAFDKASGLDEAAEQIGVTAKNLQALQFAATQGGVKMEQLDTGLTKFSQKMGEAAEGSREMVEALTKLGVKNLDVAGNLRPTEDLLVDVAKAITNIDDPARKAALAVDFFGKAGTRMLPILAEIANGMDGLGQKAEEASAIIDAKTIKTLDNAADAMARWSQVITAQLATALARLLAIVEGVTTGMLRLADAAGAGITRLIDSLEVGGAQAVAIFVEAFAAMPEALGQVFTNAWEAARVATAKGINALTSLLPDWMGLGGTSLDTAPRGTGPVGAGLGARAAAAGEAAAAAMRDRQMMARQAGMQADEDAARGGSKLGVVGGAGTTGARTSAVKASGSAAEDAEKKYAKLITQLDLAVASQDNMTAAAMRGEQAYESMKVQLEAQQKALDIFGKKLDENDPRLKQLEERMLKIAQGKVAESFALATTELTKQNVILEAQIALMGQAPEIQAREIALIKAKQEAEKAGVAVTQEMVDARRQAIEQNETLKTQAEEIKRANELWMEPVKSALQDIQSTAADAFQEMFESGKFSVESLGQVFKKTLTRMAAEFLALATIRPVMNVLVNAVSPGMAQSMGLGTGNVGSGGMLGALGGGGSGGFLGRPVFGAGETSSPMAQFAQGTVGSVGTGTNSLTWGGALGGLASMGAGAYQMFSGGGGAGSMLGGGLGMAGGLVSMLGPMMGLGAAAGPIGMGIGLLGSLLPSLFGGGTPPPPTNRAISSLNFSGGSFSQSGGSYGMDAADLGGLGSSMKSLLDAAKVKITSSSFGLQQRSFSQGEFSNATTFITGPGGAQMQWGQSSDPAQQQQALDTAGAHIAHKIMMEVDSGISDIMREGLGNYGQQNLQHAFSTAELGEAVSKLTILQDAIAGFGKTSSEAEAAIKEVDDGFKELFDIAKEFGISASEISRIELERNRQRLEVTKEFSTGIDEMLMEMKDPLQAALDANGRARDKDLVNNDEFLRLVEGYQDKRTQIMELYELQRLKIIEDGNAEALAAQNALLEAQKALVSDAIASVSRVQDLIRELSPGGALSGLDPRSQLAGLQATANASMAQAMANPMNANLVDRAVADQRAFIDFNKSFTGGTGDYHRDVQSRISMLQGLQTNIVGGAMNQTSDKVTHSYLAQILDAIRTDRLAVNNVLALLARYLANGQQAAA